LVDVLYFLSLTKNLRPSEIFKLATEDPLASKGG
jgi:hypothetical protein